MPSQPWSPDGAILGVGLSCFVLPIDPLIELEPWAPRGNATSPVSGSSSLRQGSVWVLFFVTQGGYRRRFLVAQRHSLAPSTSTDCGPPSNRQATRPYDTPEHPD